MSYESIKVYDADYDRARGIQAERGVAVIEAVGCAIEGWSRLPKRVQDQIIRERATRKHAPEAHAGTAVASSAV